LVDQLANGFFRPEYVTSETFQCDSYVVHGQHCSDVCHDAIQALTTDDGVKMYDLVKVYDNVGLSFLWGEYDIAYYGGKKAWWDWQQAPIYLFKLNPEL